MKERISMVLSSSLTPVISYPMVATPSSDPSLIFSMAAYE